MIRIYNTLTAKKEDFVPIEEGKVRMYVCGPTVYNFIHIGNARPMIVFDTVRRYFTYAGYDVNYVSNFTDVDDKIIKEAIEEGSTAEEISQRLHRGVQKGYGRPSCEARHYAPSGHEGDRRNDRDDRNSDRKGPCLRGGGRHRVFPHRKLRRLRGSSPTGISTIWRAATAILTLPGMIPEGGSAGLRPLEAEKRGRALLGEPMGRRPAGMAYRVLCHGQTLSG